MNYKEKIIARINSYDDEIVFIVKDFLDIAGHSTIRKVLNELVENKTIVRLREGIYNKPVFVKIIKEYSVPSANEVAKAVARKNNWCIGKSGNFSLNLLGLSTQVPAKYVFVTNGPAMKFKYGNIGIEFRHKSHKDLSNKSELTVMVIQALKMIRKPGVTTDDIDILKYRIPDELKPMLLAESKTTAPWVYKIIEKICE